MAQEHTGQPCPQRNVESEIIATHLWLGKEQENTFENFSQLQ